MRLSIFPPKPVQDDELKKIKQTVAANARRIERLEQKVRLHELALGLVRRDEERDEGD